MVGRRPKLTPELHKSIVEAIKAGNYAEVAAAANGIGKSTYFQWLAKGRTGRSPYAEFADAIRLAEAFAEHRAVTVIALGMKKDPKCAMWFLERKFQDRWGKKIEHKGDIGVDAVGARARIEQRLARFAASEEAADVPRRPE